MPNIVCGVAVASPKLLKIHCVAVWHVCPLPPLGKIKLQYLSLRQGVNAATTQTTAVAYLQPTFLDHSALSNVFLRFHISVFLSACLCALVVRVHVRHRIFFRWFNSETLLQVGAQREFSVVVHRYMGVCSCAFSPNP